LQKRSRASMFLHPAGPNGRPQLYQIGRLAAPDNSHGRVLPGRLAIKACFCARCGRDGCCRNGILRGRICARSGPSSTSARRRARAALRRASIRRRGVAVNGTCIDAYASLGPIGALALCAPLRGSQLCRLCDWLTATLFAAASRARHKFLSSRG
jgi:hypothetical protein